jgi:hypothetical protein
VRYGPHKLFIRTQIPVSIGSTTIQLGLTDSFATWSDGNTMNPRWFSVITDSVLTASYRVVIEPSFATAITAATILGVVVLAVMLHRRHRIAGKSSVSPTDSAPRPSVAQPESIQSPKGLLPGDNGFSGVAVKSDGEAKSA